MRKKIIKKNCKKTSKNLKERKKISKNHFFFKNKKNLKNTQFNQFSLYLRKNILNNLKKLL